MKWITNRASVEASCVTWRMIAGLLLALMVAVGSFVVARVPVARAADAIYSWTSIGYSGASVSFGDGAIFGVNPVGMTSNWGDGTTLSSSMSCDGMSISFSSAFHVVETYSGGNWLYSVDNVVLFNMMDSSFSPIPAGIHNWVWNFSKEFSPWEIDRYSTKTINFSGSWTGDPFVSGSHNIALSASIAGPSAVVTGVGGDWAASASGGTAPYTYAWSYGAIGPFFTYPYSGATFSHDLALGSWTVECKVTDSLGATAIVDKTVVSSTDVVGYEMRFARSGTYGQYVTVIVYAAGGIVAPIASTSDTQVGFPGSDGTFAWHSVTSEASWINLYWRWTLQYMSGVIGFPPPVDFWLSSTIHLTSGTTLPFTHHFSSGGEVWTGYSGDSGAPVNPEVPPAPAAPKASWYDPAVSAVKEAFQWLFVPQDWQMNLLMPGGTLGETLLDNTSWGSAASTWTMQVHWGTNVITLASMNFATIADYGFVRACRYCIQAGISLGLVYLVIVLI